MKTLVFISLLFVGVVLVHGQNSTATTTAIPTKQTTEMLLTTNAPANSTDAVVKTFKYSDGNITCLIVTLKAYFNQSGKITNVSNDAKLDDSSSSCSSMTVSFGNNYNLSLIFQKNSKMYWLHQIDANIGFGNVEMPNLSVGNSTLKASYKCDSGFTETFSGNVTMVATNVQFQAFEVKNNKYGTAQICTADIGNNIIVPIAIGCALVGLIVIVLIAYMIGRKQVKHRYEAM